MTLTPLTVTSVSFNPRAREGRDKCKELFRAVLPGFNPRAREGRDTRARAIPAARGSFNPRAREGRDILA